MGTAAELRSTLARIDGRGYKAYRDLAGAWDLRDEAGLELFVDRVQGDPFAAPSKLRVRMPLAEAALPSELLDTRVRRLALADLLARRVRQAIETRGRRSRGSGRSGALSIDAGGQEVLERSAAQIADDWVELRLEAGLPAAGRRVLGREAEALLLGDLVDVAREGLVAVDSVDDDSLDAFVRCIENQEHLRGQLREHDLIAFAADGAILPRASGADDRPLRGASVVPFAAPETLRVELSLATPHQGRSTLTGLGIPRGVTLVVGGGYHGKSTLLRAVERGVYPHVPGDGREWVVSDPGLVKIRAEDGRRVVGVDIEGFVRELPGGRATRAFTSEDASGSTSQAAAIVEALEAGATGLLLDEDTSATNFMVRDARMQALVSHENEPITPYLDRVRELWKRFGVSTLLVMGGSGDYFEVADTVLALRDYRVSEVSDEARRIAEQDGVRRRSDAPGPLRAPAPRAPRADSVDPSHGRREVKIAADGTDRLRFGREEIDLRALEQLVDPSQARAIGGALHYARRWMDGATAIPALLDRLEQLFDAEGLDALDPFHRPGAHPGALARPRRFEIAAALGRLRSLKLSG